MNRTRLATALAFAGACAAARADYPTETFEGAPCSNFSVPSGPIAGTGFEVVAGTVWVQPANTLSHGHVLDLGSGVYASTCGTAATADMSATAGTGADDTRPSTCSPATPTRSTSTFRASPGRPATGRSTPR